MDQDEEADLRNLLLTATLLAHSWYPSQCCSDRDCAPVPCADLERMIRSGEVDQKTVRDSPDEECHLCTNPGATVAAPPSTVHPCAWKPRETA